MPTPSDACFPFSTSPNCWKHPLAFAFRLACGSLLATSALIADETNLLARLASGTAAEKDAARQALLVAATAATVPGLAAQLDKPETFFDNACFLLESLKLPEADAALADALGRTSGREQAALLDTLARRRSPLAKTIALRLSAESADPVRSAALRYLYAAPPPDGCLSAESIENLDPRAADAALTGAERLAAKKPGEAAACYAALYANANLPDHVRLAAYCGLLRTDPGNAAARLAEGLSHASPLWRGTAARLAAELPDKTLKKLGMKLMAALPPQSRLDLIGALVAAKKRAGAPLLRAALADVNDAQARLAAAAGLGDLGDGDDAPALIALLDQPDAAIADAARVSLAKLADTDTDDEIASALKRNRLKTAAGRVRLLDVARLRNIRAAARCLPAYLSDADAAVRAAALQAAATLAGEREIAAVFDAACRASQRTEKRAAEQALFALSRNYPAASADAVRALLANAKPDSRRLLLQALGISGSPKGLDAVVASLKDADPDVADDALRVLAAWKDPAATPVLLEQAKSHAKNSLRILALRGFIRLIGQMSQTEARAAMCREAAALATRTEEKLLLAAAWATVPTPEAVAALKPYLADDALKTEALKALKILALKVPVDVPDQAPGSLLSPLTFIPRRLGTFRSEACGVADFNGDSKLDIVAGPYLYLAPDWKPRRIRTLAGSVDEAGKGYYDDFCNLPLDVNKDGRPDVVSAGWFSKTSYWFENMPSAEGEWPVHVIDPLGNHETGTLEDVDGDGQAREFLPQTHIMVWYEVGTDTNGAPNLVRHAVSEKRGKLGAGCGDINGDGRPDIVRPDAWYEAPKDIRAGAWIEHPLSIGAPDGGSDHSSNIIVYDVNRDGLNDLIASIAHKHGIWWYEQKRGADGAVSWTQHTIDATWSQPHYLAFADIDGDGNKEIISGKRFMAHNGNDPDEFGKLCVFYYRFTPGANPVFRKHVISYDQGIGAGLNIVAADMDGDGDLDLVTTGKWGGPVLFENRMTEWVSD